MLATEPLNLRALVGKWHRRGIADQDAQVQGSVASSAPPQSRPNRRCRGAQCGQGRYGDRQDSIPSRITHNFVELGSDLVDLRMNSVHACQVFGTMPEPISISFF